MKFWLYAFCLSNGGNDEIKSWEMNTKTILQRSGILDRLKQTCKAKSKFNAMLRQYTFKIKSGLAALVESKIIKSAVNSKTSTDDHHKFGYAHQVKFKVIRFINEIEEVIFEATSIQEREKLLRIFY